jgi:hypothetical protein
MRLRPCGHRSELGGNYPDGQTAPVGSFTEADAPMPPAQLGVLATLLPILAPTFTEKR